MHRTRAELQLTPFTLTLPAYRIAQLRQIAEATNARHEADNGYNPGVTAESIATALLVQALERIEGENQQ